MASEGRSDESEADCFDEDTAAAYAARQLSATERELLDEHASRCDRCRRMLSATFMEDGDARGEPMRLRGSTLGRYVVLDCLGAGGMSVVYRAYDPELDRKVAIKLLHQRDGSSEEEGTLVREAKAAAMVVHPNIVAMYDLGTSDDERYIVMELVDGDNVRQWLAAEKRSWRQILGVFRQAGQGIAAAHRQGLIHRDLKPDNILVGRDGCVRVADFGLARASASLGPMVKGEAAGTPAYMAPEQRAGIVDERSDQYSYCASFHEALFGTRDLMAAPTKRSRVPRWLARIVRRGTTENPALRFPSMDALLAAITRVRLYRRMAIAGAGALVVAAVVVAMSHRRHAPPWWELGVGAARDAGLMLGHDHTDGWYCGASSIFSHANSVHWRDPKIFESDSLYEVVGATVYAIGHCLHGCDEGPSGVPAHCNFSPGFDPLLRIPEGKYRRFCGGPRSALGIEPIRPAQRQGTFALYRQSLVAQNLFYTVFVSHDAAWDECP